MAARSRLAGLLCLSILSAFILPHVSGKGEDSKQELEILDRILSAGYDARARPEGNATSEGSKPTVVTVNMFVRAIQDLDTHKQEARVQVTFRQEWNDYRLAFDDQGGKIKYLTLAAASRIWAPDLFFTNSRGEQFHTAIRPNVLIRIFPNGNIYHSIRLTLGLSCPMDLGYFPFDTQMCGITVASYGYTTDDLVLLWKHSAPVQIPRQLSIPEFSLIKFQTSYATSKTTTGSYSAARADLIFRREASRYWRQVFGPSIAFLILSYAALWLKSSKQRFLLSLISVLLTSYLVMDTNQRLPSVSYSRSIDVWTGFVFVLPIVNLLIVALSSYVPEEVQQDEKEKSVEDGAGEPLVDKKAESKLDAGRKVLAKVTKARFELAARIGIPVVSVLFVTIFYLRNVINRE